MFKSSNPHEKLLKEARVFSHVTDEETEVQFLGTHSY